MQHTFRALTRVNAHQNLAANPFYDLGDLWRMTDNAYLHRAIAGDRRVWEVSPALASYSYHLAGWLYQFPLPIDWDN